MIPPPAEQGMEMTKQTRVPHKGPRWGQGHIQYFYVPRPLSFSRLQSGTSSKAMGQGVGQKHADQLRQHCLTDAIPECGAYNLMESNGSHVLAMIGVIDCDTKIRQITPCGV